MKRALLILLIVILPLQTAWAAGFCLRMSDGAPAAAVPAVSAVDSINADEYAEPGCCPTCKALCQLPAFVCASLSSMSLLQPAYALAMPLLISRYQSPVPDGPIRPKWTSVS